MGLGLTNAVIGSGGGSNFVAYIQVTTDANAQISVVNLHGDAFSGTANSSGSLTLTVTAPGTYTVSETGGGTATVAVIDYGVSYSVSVYAFNGTLIDSGVALVSFEQYVLSGSGELTVSTQTVLGRTVLEVENQNGLGSIEYRTASFIDVSEYSYLKVQGERNSSYIYVYMFDENNSDTAIGTLPSGFNTTTLSVSGFSGNYKIGTILDSGWKVDFLNMWLE